MKIINITFDNDFIFNEEISLCLGYFDGLHLGHQKLFNISKNSKYQSSVLTFIQDKEILLKQKKHLTSFDDKVKKLEKLGIKYLFVINFNNDVKNMNADVFINYIIKNLNCKEIIVGNDFRFGLNKLGDVELIKKYIDNVIVVDDVKINDERISTSKICRYLSAGDIITANKLLGYKYKITSKVERGYSLGTKKLFPTANISFNNYFIPKNGVYQVNVFVNENEYKGLANVGIHPTVNTLQTPILEVYILDFNENIYDEKIDVEFIKFIRDEKKFKSLEELKKQIKIDLASF